eukprot:scaffold218465_cov18-Tisochrysis_lutea.AAC.1
MDAKNTDMSHSMASLQCKALRQTCCSSKERDLSYCSQEEWCRLPTCCFILPQQNWSFLT